MGPSMSGVGRSPRAGQSVGATLFQLLVALPTLAGLSILAVHQIPRYNPVVLVCWVFILAAIELLPVPAWRGLQLSLGFPIRLGMAILYPPGLAASLAWVGS